MVTDLKSRRFRPCPSKRLHFQWRLKVTSASQGLSVCQASWTACRCNKPTVCVRARVGDWLKGPGCDGTWPAARWSSGTPSRRPSAPESVTPAPAPAHHTGLQRHARARQLNQCKRLRGRSGRKGGRRGWSTPARSNGYCSTACRAAVAVFRAAVCTWSTPRVKWGDPDTMCPSVCQGQGRVGQAFVVPSFFLVRRGKLLKKIFFNVFALWIHILTTFYGQAYPRWKYKLTYQYHTVVQWCTKISFYNKVDAAGCYSFLASFLVVVLPGMRRQKSALIAR